MRVVLSTTALLSFVSVWKTAALAIAELGVGAFFAAAIVRAQVGPWAPWAVLAAAVISLLVRAIDLESWAVLVPGGLVGRAETAFGPRAGRLAAATALVERLALAALAAALVGHYAAAAVTDAVVGWPLTRRFTADDIATTLAVAVMGSLWIRERLGRPWPADRVARGIWIGIAVLGVATAWGIVTVSRAGLGLTAFAWPSMAPAVGSGNFGQALLWGLTAFGLAFTVAGGGDALTADAHELQPPRVRALRRSGLIVGLFTVLVTVPLAFVFTAIVPTPDLGAWLDAPLPAIADHLAGPAWATHLLMLSLVAAALLLLVPGAHSALTDAQQLLRRLAEGRALPEGLAAPHPRLGTFARALDVAAVGVVGIVIIMGGGRVSWLSHAYVIAMMATLLVKIAALTRLRATTRDPRPYRAPLNVRFLGRELPLGLLGTGALVGASAIGLLAVGDIAALAMTLTLVALALVLVTRPLEPGAARDGAEGFELLPSSELPFQQVDARPANLLVAVRNVHQLSHLRAALEAPGDRDVVVMTARLLGVDVDEDASQQVEPTLAERRLFSRVMAIAERYNRSVRLLIVPARNVFDAVIAAVLRLQSSEVYVGESATLTAADQARLLGEAWERAPKAESLHVRLVVHRRSGRTDAYHLGAHPPTLTPGDVDLIHRLWLDAVKSVGPHVHHHDVVRAALTQMDQQMNGPQRDDALATIRRIARPGDELAAAVRARDLTGLRDMLRNRHASDLAGVLTELGIEDQVVVFRVLPRKDAAAVFEYLSTGAKETLLKAMAQEEVAALLNDMAPDDRTMFLEELPAAATRQLLSLLTPPERSVALTLLGYPEKSIGRLMTPQYIAVREHWTIREVLDYIREHGHDSETLNVVYVVDDEDVLVDDIRIREFLLSPLDARVTDLMDRRFVALKATDDQQSAVAVFRQYDRSALPVTDTAGTLIGIVTIDDVLDVAEASATKDIQRIGGSEALDEPYMKIAFLRMVQKRAGWLTALFLGEMLTATAMGAFEAEISRAVVLALFVPLIISSGGNSGSQASTLVIRALALGEVGLRDWWRVMRREIMAGLALGAILGSVGFLRITVWSAFSDIYGPHWLLVALTVALALVGIVLWGTLVGSLLPFLLRRLGFDPATSSAPFVATLVDVTGLVIYFSVATVVLRGTLL